MTIVSRGLACRCPNCGERSLFEKGRAFKINERCAVCGLRIEKGDGAFLGPFVINYAVTAFGFVVPVVALYALGKLSAGAALGVGLALAFTLPIAFYRIAWGWWLALYYAFFPQNLPANLEGGSEDDE